MPTYVDVELLSSMDNEMTRTVVIPERRDLLSVDQLLELVFVYGQNDFQPVRHRCSVSCGDVALIDRNQRYLCAGMGWLAITEEWYQDYLAVPRQDRQLVRMRYENTVHENMAR